MKEKCRKSCPILQISRFLSSVKSIYGSPLTVCIVFTACSVCPIALSSSNIQVTKLQFSGHPTTATLKSTAMIGTSSQSNPPADKKEKENVIDLEFQAYFYRFYRSR